MYAAAMVGQAAVNTVNGALNNYYTAWREAEARRENYKYSEMSADAADKRTRALYEDYYSPQAMLRQYKEAGLSPSLMFANGAGGSGATPNGAQGNGAVGISPTTYGISPIDFAQIQLANAQAEREKAQAENLNKDTEIKELQKEYDTMTTQLFADSFKVLQTNFQDENGKPYSIFEKAARSRNYEEFYEWSKEHFAMRESEQKTLRSIYLAANEYDRDIEVLSSENISAKFQQGIVSCLMDKGFESLNAESAIENLRRNIQTAELDERQSKAWNNLLNRLERKNATIHDIVIIVSMIVNNALSNYKGTVFIPNVSANVSTKTN